MPSSALLDTCAAARPRPPSLPFPRVLVHLEAFASPRAPSRAPWRSSLHASLPRRLCRLSPSPPSPRAPRYPPCTLPCLTPDDEGPPRRLCRRSPSRPPPRTPRIVARALFCRTHMCRHPSASALIILPARLPASTPVPPFALATLSLRPRPL
ncbi:hypothetical protein BDW22DRAFT_1430851 [Trametopsis cervina]|nr:hypothetical protein BDW22DRAFT_1430851 [Trametopsis cervina]